MQEQLLLAVLPTGESEKEGQSVHMDELVADEYLPFMQSRQVTEDVAPNMFEYLPGWHIVQTTESTPECVPCGHKLQ